VCGQKAKINQTQVMKDDEDPTQKRSRKIMADHERLWQKRAKDSLNSE
jgi:hypothetical protein